MSKSTNYDFLKVKDLTDNYYTPIPTIFDIPMRSDCGEVILIWQNICDNESFTSRQIL